MKIELFKTNEVIPYAHNPRDHSQDQVKKIALSIESFGFSQPIVIDEDNVILVGHGRHKAAQLLNLESVPCVIVKGLEEWQKKAYRILDNKIQNESNWNLAHLETELDALKDSGFNFDVFGLNELVALLGEPLTEVDRKLEWQGMPEYEHRDLEPYHSITIYIDNESQLPELSTILEQKITPDTKSVWYPKQEREEVKGKAYIAK
jgi:hypothetical protein